MGLLRLLPEALSSRRSFYLAIFCIAVMVAAVTAGPPRPMRKHNMAQKRSSAGKHRPFLKMSGAPPEKIMARANGEAVIECSARGRPAPEITWLKDGVPVRKEYIFKDEEKLSTFPLDSLAETKSRLSIECVAESDAAVYECVAENEADRLTAETKVAVSSSLGGNGDACLSRRLASSRVSPPAIHQWMGTYLQVMGTDAHLICRADGNAAEIVWMDPNDDVIEYDGDKYLPLSNGDLIVRDLDFGDMGMFKCVARNEFGEDMKETFVFPTAAA